MLEIEVTKNNLAGVNPKQRATPPIANDLAPPFD
jgi:hypothetical protein